MSGTEQFIELVNNVCRVPKMFTLNGTYGEVVALFTGFQIAASGSPIADDEKRTLNQFINARLLVPDKYWWPGAVRMVTHDDETAIAKLRDLLIEFATLTETHSLAEIRESAERARNEYVEPEPARVWRHFLAARYSADQSLIEPLILPHPQADILWRDDGWPPDVADQLTQISDSYVVSVVSGSLESGKVSLVTEVGLIDAQLVDGNWRIDASSFIDNDLQRDA